MCHAGFSGLGIGTLKLISGVWIKVNKKLLVWCSFWWWFEWVFVSWSSSLVDNKHEKITLSMAHESGGHLEHG